MPSREGPRPATEREKGPWKATSKSAKRNDKTGAKRDAAKWIAAKRNTRGKR